MAPRATKRGAEEVADVNGERSGTTEPPAKRTRISAQSEVEAAAAEDITPAADDGGPASVEYVYLTISFMTIPDNVIQRNGAQWRQCRCQDLHLWRRVSLRTVKSSQQSVGPSECS